MGIIGNGELQELCRLGEHPNRTAREGIRGSGHSGFLEVRAPLGEDRVQELMSKLNHLSELRQQRIAALGMAVRQGSYRIGARQTAEALLTEMQERAA
jgi:hypothetical protein